MVTLPNVKHYFTFDEAAERRRLNKQHQEHRAVIDLISESFYAPEFILNVLLVEKSTGFSIS